MALFLPQRWRRQPPYVTGVDWSNPLTLGLRNLWNMAGRGVRDATGAANGTPIGGGGLLATTDGLGANFDSSGTTYIDLARPNQFNLANGSRWSIMFRVRTTTDTSQALFHYGDGTTNNRFALFIGDGVASGLTNELITFARIIGATQTPLAGYTTVTRTQLVDGAIHSVMLTSNGSTIAIYLDGLSRTVTIGNGVQNGLINLSGVTATTATLGAQNVGTISSKFNGQMTFGAFWAADVSRYALELHRNPWQLFRPANSPVFYSLPSAGGAQTLTPDRYDNTNTFYTPIVTSAYQLVAGRYDNQNTFYSPTVTTTYALTSARYDNTSTFYSPTVTSGAFVLLPDRYDNAQTFYSPTVTAGTVTLTPARYDNAQTFYTPTVSLASQALLPDRFDNVNTFYSPSLAVVTLYKLKYWDGSAWQILKKNPLF